jgi:hypothetical protein
MRAMQFMILVKADKDSEAGILPDEKILTEMGKFNIELEKAGVLLAGEGLQAIAWLKRAPFGDGTEVEDFGKKPRRS